MESCEELLCELGIEVDTSLDALQLNYEHDWSSERKFTFTADSIRETVQTVVRLRPVPLDGASDKRKHFQTAKKTRRKS